MYNKNSQLVKTWVSLVFTGVYTEDQIPKQGNLKDVVLEVIKEVTGGDEVPAEQPTEQPAEPVDLMAMA